MTDSTGRLAAKVANIQDIPKSRRRGHQFGQSLSQRYRRFDSNLTILDIGQTSVQGRARFGRGGPGCRATPPIHGKIANFTTGRRYENTTVRLELLAFHQVLPS
jgi:hypothetical protein